MQKDDNNGIHFNYTYTNEQLNYNYNFANFEKNEIIQLFLWLSSYNCSFLDFFINGYRGIKRHDLIF